MDFTFHYPHMHIPSISSHYNSCIISLYLGIGIECQRLGLGFFFDSWSSSNRCSSTIISQAYLRHKRSSRVQGFIFKVDHKLLLNWQKIRVLVIVTSHDHSWNCSCLSACTKLCPTWFHTSFWTTNSPHL